MSRKDLFRRFSRVTRELAELLEIAMTPGPKKKSALAPLDDAILESLQDGKLKSEDLAERAGYPLNSHFRAALTKLARQGAIVRTPDGYALPE